MRSQVRLTALSAVALFSFAACSVSDLSAPADSSSSMSSGNLTGAGAGTQASHSPVVTIQTPTRDTTARQFESVTLTGLGVSFWGVTLTGSSLVWKSDRDGQIGTGASVVTALSVGSHVITLTGTDSRGLAGSATRSITIAPNQAPTAAITAPATNISVVEGTSVTLSGTGTDPEDMTIPDTSMTWFSNSDGVLGNGRTLTRANLSVGTHNITLTVRDSRGLSGSATRTVNVTANQAPYGLITSPSQASSYAQGVSISFTGSASDPEDGALTGASIVWKSNLDGQIGTGTSFVKSNLSIGTHTISMTSTDSKGAAFTHNRSITITAAVNQAPTATISAPGSGSSFSSNASVTFTGSALDPESGALTGSSLVWVSDHDGQIGTGTSFTRSNLSPGTHTITLTARDPQGAAGTATRSFTITTALAVNQAPTANFVANCSLLVCSFNASGSSDDNGITQYSWNFGNGMVTSVLVPTVSATYLVAGTVSVSLTVRDAAGLTSSVTKSVTLVSSIITQTSGAAEPSGMTVLADNAMNCVSGCNNWYFSQSYAGAATLVSDATAPRSSGNVVQQNFNASLPGGSSPATLGVGLAQRQTIYMSLWMKYSANYVGHPTGINKAVHFWTKGVNPVVLIARGAGSDRLTASFNLQRLAAPYSWTSGSYQFNSTEVNLSPNLGACTIVRGQWHKYEVVLTNNTPGVADGRIEYWLDGAKCGDYGQLMFVGAGENNKWEEVMWSPTWGGMGGTITGDFNVQVDHMYISGK
jgi:PKD repeat protein